jgi:hypothetical protein
MAEIVGSLFGVTPDMYERQQRQSALNEGIAMARLAPEDRAQAMIYSGAAGLGRAGGGLLGAEDPQMKLISARQQIMSQTDQSDPQSLANAAKQLNAMGDTQGAMALMDFARKAQSEMALVGQRRAAETASLAQAAKTNLTIRQEEELRTKLSQLGPNATEDQVIGVLTQYGPPEKVLAALTTAQSRKESIQARTESAQAANQARIDAAQLSNQARIDAAKIAADARIEAARMAGSTATQIAQMRADSAKELRELTSSLKGPKVLAPSLQKEEDKELELVDSLTARETSLAPAIATLTPDPKTGKPPLELGPVNNLRYQAQNAAGNSSVESRNYAALQRAVQEATNLKTDAAKGVQTDKDVLRFANELIAAFGGNDTKTTLEALSNFSKSTGKAKENAQKRIDSRRKSQGVEPYYGPALGTASNPIKLD